jgi:hypothetical protein
MLTARFAHFEQKARIVTREDDRMTFSEAAITRLVLATSDSIIRRSRKKLNREWSSFAEDQEVDPFASHARVELHIDRTGLFTGSWQMCVYWEPDKKDWAGMHLQFDCIYVWPLFCTTVF